jgi:polyhydroxybutyrate depolymerase
MPHLPAGSHPLTLEHGGRLRRYVVHIPAHGPHPLPVVLAFHGAGGTARIMLHHSRWLQQSEKGGFAVVAPEGTPPKLREKPSFRFNPQLWNLGGTSTAAPTGNTDDVGFVRAILERLPQFLEVDGSRVYATGFSNGAGLCFRLAVELGRSLAAIGPVAGYPYLKNGPPPRPIPTYYLVGSLDPLIPWQGGEVVSPWSGMATQRPSVLHALQQWRELSGFIPVPESVSPNSPVQALGQAPEGAVLQYEIVPGLGHHWPGGKDVGVPQEVLGPRIKTFDGAEKLWQFFSHYALS